MEMRNKAGQRMVRTDSLLVSNNYILEPIKLYTSNSETRLDPRTGATTHREISSGSRVKWYCFTDLKAMVGLLFDVDQAPSSKTIEPYQVHVDKPKRGTGFIIEPYLQQDVKPTDYVKEKDTVINGQQCFLVKRTKVVQHEYKGRKLDKVVKFRIAINPNLPFYALPFVSEKIPQHFGGGAVVYIEGEMESGVTSTLHYAYSDFTDADQKLYAYYQGLYQTNIELLDGLKE
ncbi:hypothetical protein [Pedobacter faecalis]|uniref:hypothetical protein n=1 Tax=Pedobacter faecalis TaxID=3041495 RepID=UPI00254D8A52|nr:hypothetical protein [Pedobacter sp. ELA7]